MGLAVSPLGPLCRAETRARGQFLSTQAYRRCLINADALLGGRGKANEGTLLPFQPQHRPARHTVGAELRSAPGTTVCPGAGPPFPGSQPGLKGLMAGWQAASPMLVHLCPLGSSSPPVPTHPAPNRAPLSTKAHAWRRGTSGHCPEHTWAWQDHRRGRCPAHRAPGAGGRLDGLQDGALDGTLPPHWPLSTVATQAAENVGPATSHLRGPEPWFPPLHLPGKYEEAMRVANVLSSCPSRNQSHLKPRHRTPCSCL